MNNISFNGWKINAKKESYEILKEKYRYPAIFPENLLEKAIDLNKAYSEGYYKLAWKNDDAIEVINFFAEHGFVIIGGYAYLSKNNEFEFLGDNWTFKPANEDEKIISRNGVRYVTYDFNYDNYFEREKILEDSVKKAKDYIQFYVSRNGGDNSYFSFIFKFLDI
nr:hypothetical protein [uncultured Methanolobus sp.]